MSNLVASLPSPDENENNYSVLTKNLKTQKNFKLKSRIEKYDPSFIYELIDLSQKLSAGFTISDIEASTTISSTTKKLTNAWKKLANSIIDTTKHPKLIHGLRQNMKNAAIDSALQDHTLKSIDSIKDKKTSSADSNLNIKDSVRCTTKLSKSVETKEELLKCIKNSLLSIQNDKKFDNCLFIDRKFKIKPNLYCDLSFYFLITIGNKLKIVEIQVLTQDYFDEKVKETPIYKEAKKICANLNLGYKKGVDTDLLYTYFRSLYDKYGVEIFDKNNSLKLKLEITHFLNDFIKNSQALVDGIFLKSSKVPKYDIINPNEELISEIQKVAELFLKSLECYSNTKPLIKSTQDLNWLNAQTESLIQIPNLLDTNHNPKDGDLKNFLTQDNIDSFKQRLEHIYSLETQI